MFEKSAKTCLIRKIRVTINLCHSCANAENKQNRKNKEKNKSIRQQNKSFLCLIANESSKKEKHEEI